MPKKLQFQALPKLPADVWILGFGSLLMDLSSESLHALNPLYLVNILGAQVVVVGILEGTSDAVASVLRMCSGVLSDYLKRRKPLIVLGYSLSALSKPLFPMATSVSLIFFATVCDRVGKGIRSSHTFMAGAGFAFLGLLTYCLTVVSDRKAA